MTVNLSPKWTAFIREKLASGEYTSEQQLLEAALANLATTASIHWPAPEKLRALAEQGNADIDAGRVTDGHTAVASLRARLKARHS